MHTPYFMINKRELDNSFSLLKNSLKSEWNNYIIGYSFKTNSLPWIINYYKNLGCYAEVVSDDEYHLALLEGYKKDRIIYNGPMKSEETFVEALFNGCIVNIDSEREIRWLKNANLSQKVSVGIRVNFDLEASCLGQSACGNEGGRFGFCYENNEFEKAIAALKENGRVEIAGLHLHCSSKTRSLEVYRQIALMACEIQERYNLKLRYIDVGGGFFGGLSDRPQFPQYLQLLSEILATHFDVKDTTLIVEPGMSLIGPCIDYVTSVIDVKTTSYNRFVVTDGSRIHIDPLMTKNTYFYDIQQCKAGSEIIDKQIICGFTCMEHDRLFTLTKAAQLREYDKIIYHKVGAYTMCLSPLFIRYYPDIYVDIEDRYFKVRERWTPSNYVQNSRSEIEEE